MPPWVEMGPTGCLSRLGANGLRAQRLASQGGDSHREMRLHLRDGSVRAEPKQQLGGILSVGHMPSLTSVRENRLGRAESAEHFLAAHAAVHGLVSAGGGEHLGRRGGSTARKQRQNEEDRGCLQGSETVRRRCWLPVVEHARATLRHVPQHAGRIEEVGDTGNPLGTRPWATGRANDTNSSQAMVSLGYGSRRISCP